MLNSDHLAFLDLLAGLVMVSAILMRPALGRLGLPSLVVFVALGFMLRLADERWTLVSEQGAAVLGFLASIGIIVLLFRVGLDSNLHGLLGKLRRATPIWLGNVVLSGVPAVLLCRWWLGLDLVPSLFVGIALTATSIAVAAEVWREAGALDSAEGETLVDVAELDDLSGIVMLALLMAVAPLLRANDGGLAPALAATGGLLVLKGAAFVGACVLIARYGERVISRRLSGGGSPDAILLVLGPSIIIATAAAALGFSLAIGALFAGLIFSRDPEAVRREAALDPIQSLFAPFFFVSIGFAIAPEALVPGLALGLPLLAVAVLGKVVGAGLPARLTTGWVGAAAIGVSMVPRAEIAMVIAHEGQALGAWALPAAAYAAIALISLATSLVAPVVVRLLLQRLRLRQR